MATSVGQSIPSDDAGPSTSGHGCSRFRGKVAVITGSTAGIGLAIAQRLGSEGAKVVVSSRQQKSVDETVVALRAKGVDCVGCVCHVGNTAHRDALIDTAIKTYGKIDVLVSNAVVNPTMGPLLDTPEEATAKILDVNVKSALLLAQRALPHIPSGGSVIFVTSIVAYHPTPPLAMYAVSKTALLGLVKALATEVGPRNVRVNGLAPGFVPTKFSRALVESPQLREQQESQTMLGRLGTPGEIAGVAAFLASSDAAYVTGETIIAAGGMPSKL